MSQAFGNGKRTIQEQVIPKIYSININNYAKNLSKDRCGYVRNDTVNDQFTIRYDYLENQLISRVRNVKNYETLFLCSGHNVCNVGCWWYWCFVGAGGAGGAGGWWCWCWWWWCWWRGWWL